MLTGNSGDEPEWPQDPECSEGLGVHSFDVEARHEDVEEADHDDGEVKEVGGVAQVRLFVLPHAVSNYFDGAFRGEDDHEYHLDAFLNSIYRGSEFY